MANVKPIETTYNGYRFRSRLEARWAVFLDALNVKLDYEPEGYDLGEFGWYLPDFYLQGVTFFQHGVEGTFLEIKPLNWYAADDLADPMNKALALSRLFGHTREVIVAYGLPGEHIVLVAYTPTDGGGACLFVSQLVYEDGKLGHLPIASLSPKVLEIEEYYGDAIDYADKTAEEVYQSYGEMPELQRAIKAARQARFEHGESGARQ